MKKNYLKALLLLVLCCFSVACTDDPENPDEINNTPTIPTSYLKYDGKYFELTKGFFTVPIVILTLIM